MVETNTPVCDTLDDLRSAPAAAAGAGWRRPPSRTGSASSRRARCRSSSSTAATSRPAPGSPTCSTSTRCWSTSSRSAARRSTSTCRTATRPCRSSAASPRTYPRFSRSPPARRTGADATPATRATATSSGPAGRRRVRPPMVETGAEYDLMIKELIASGTISDPGMVYFDVRPSAHVPTVELRICDACPEVDFVVLIAGLFRALVRRAREECAAGVPLPVVRQELLRAATWRAARSGLEGDLVDPVGSHARLPRAAHRAAGRLAAPAPGGARRLRAGARSCRRSRSAAAARRPASAAASGCGASSPTSSTASSPPPRAANLPFDRPPSIVTAPKLLGDYRPSGFDEAVSEEGNVLRGVRLDVPHALAHGHPRHERRREGAAHRAAGPRRHLPGGRRARAAVPARPDAPDHHRRRLGRAHRRARPARPGARGLPARRLHRAADRRGRRHPRLGGRRGPGPQPPGQARAAGRGADRRGRHRPGARPAGPLDGARGQPAGPVGHGVLDHEQAADPQRDARSGAAHRRRRPGGRAAPAPVGPALGRRPRTGRATTRSRCCRRARSTRRSSSTSCSPTAWACLW